MRERLWRWRCSAGRLGGFGGIALLILALLVSGPVIQAQTVEPPPTASSLFTPYGVALDSTNNVFVADQANNRVLQFSSACPEAGCSADDVFGQPSFTTNTVGASASSLNAPRDVAVDATGNLYVADDLNNRVLLFPDTCAPAGCTATGVFGKPSLAPTPALAPSPSPSATATSASPVAFASPTPTQTTAASLDEPWSLVLDGAGDLYVADSANNRVLEFPSGCAPGGCAATRVFGQPDFASTLPDTTATALSGPRGLALDANNNLYVADAANFRVLEFPGDCPPAGCAAIRVFGQTDFISASTGTSATTLAGAWGVAVDPLGNVYVADADNNRVVEYPSTCPTTGCAALRVLGQSDFVSSAPTAGATGLNGPRGLATDSAGNLYVVDSSNNRVLEFPSTCVLAGCAANRVFGQDSL